MSNSEDLKKQFNPPTDGSGNGEVSSPSPSFITRFVNFLSSLLKKKEVKDNNFFISEADSDDEKEAIEASCNDIDNYYAELEKLRQLDDGYNANRYLVDSLQQLNREDGIEEDDDAVSEKLSKYWDKEAVENASTLFDQVTDPKNETDNEELQ